MSDQLIDIASYVRYKLSNWTATVVPYASIKVSTNVINVRYNVRFWCPALLSRCCPVLSRVWSGIVRRVLTYGVLTTVVSPVRCYDVINYNFRTQKDVDHPLRAPVSTQHTARTSTREMIRGLYTHCERHVPAAERQSVGARVRVRRAVASRRRGRGSIMCVCPVFVTSVYPNYSPVPYSTCPHTYAYARLWSVGRAACALVCMLYERRLQFLPASLTLGCSPSAPR